MELGGGISKWVGGAAKSPSHLGLSKVPRKASATFFLCLLVNTGALSHWASDHTSEKSKFQVENSEAGCWS